MGKEDAWYSGLVIPPPARETVYRMIRLKEAAKSTLFRKYLMSVSGLSIVGFVVVHLAGNLALYGDGTAFNAYAKQLHDLGPLLWAAEIALLGIFLLHIVVAFGIQVKNRAAGGGRRYAVPQTSKGGPSYLSVASRRMFITGAVLMVFLVVHVMHFKYGFFFPEGVAEQTVLIDGEQAVDLYARVAHTFAKPLWVAMYVVVMVGLGVHLWHGFWSAFQSLGALNHRLEKPAVILGHVVAVVLALGFLGIPLFFFLQSLGA